MMTLGFHWTQRRTRVSQLVGLGLATIWLSCPQLVMAQVVMAQGSKSQEAALAGGLAVLAAAEQATISAIESAERSIVAISRVRRGRAPTTTLEPLRFGSPFTNQDLPSHPDYVPEFFGSGVVISDEGHILICGHVVEDPRENDYYVWLNKQGYTARVVGQPAKVLASDPFSDLAVLKIDATNLQPVRFATDELRKGQFVIALGNPQAIARDGQASASWGIISNLNRVAPTEKGDVDANKESIHHYGTLIQTDAKLNLGTSGGALVNFKGEMVGLTTSLAATTGFEQAAGFAIAVDAMFLRVIEMLKLGKLPEYGFLGIQPEDLRLAEKARGMTGARVSVVIPGLPGEAAGLRADDVIFQVGDRQIQNRNDLFRELSVAAAGERVQLVVHRLRPGREGPEIIHLPAVLSKKPMTARRPGYAIHGQPKWRGMWVEYATAVPSELLRGGVLSARRSPPKLSILAVDPDTPAWEAGLRPGYGVVAVSGRSVETPTEFYELVEGQNGPVQLTLIRSDQQSERIVVSAPRPADDSP